MKNINFYIAEKLVINKASIGKKTDKEYAPNSIVLPVLIWITENNNDIFKTMLPIQIVEVTEYNIKFKEYSEKFSSFRQSDYVYANPHINSNGYLETCTDYSSYGANKKDIYNAFLLKDDAISLLNSLKNNDGRVKGLEDITKYFDGDDASKFTNIHLRDDNCPTNSSDIKAYYDKLINIFN